jgi:Tat protein secretion system quality control protein TatD with DNase activity
MIIDIAFQFGVPKEKNAQAFHTILQQLVADGHWLILRSTDYATAKLACSLSVQYKQGVYSMAGFSPANYDTSLTEFAELRQMAASCHTLYPKDLEGKDFASGGVCAGRIVSIGETGINDILVQQSDKPRKVQADQRNLIIRHMRMAHELALPLILSGKGENTTSTVGDLVDIVAGQALREYMYVPFVVLDFAGTVDQARRLVQLGGHFGVSMDTVHIYRQDSLRDVIPVERLHIHSRSSSYVVGETLQTYAQEMDGVLQTLSGLYGYDRYSFEHKIEANSMSLFSLNA